MERQYKWMLNDLRIAVVPSAYNAAKPLKGTIDEIPHELTRPVGAMKLPAIQSLRGIAAILVVFNHYAIIYRDTGQSWIFKSGLGFLGASGVDIFFVISGFIMAYTSRSKTGSRDALTFLKKRAIRVYPIYWVWTSLLLVAVLAGFGKTMQHPSAEFIVRSYLLLPTFDVAHYFGPLLPQGWTLIYEMLFYVVFACSIGLALRASKLLFMAAIFAVLALLSIFLSPTNAVRHVLSDPIIAEFLYGVLAAEVLFRLPTIRSHRFVLPLSWSLIAIGGAALLCTVMLDPFVEQIPRAVNAHAGPSLRFVWYGIPAAFLVSGAAMRASRPVPRLLVYFGDSSYSIYLSHLFVAMAFGLALKHSANLRRVPADLVILIMGTVTVLACSLTYAAIERPILDALSSKPRVGMAPFAIETS